MSTQTANNVNTLLLFIVLGAMGWLGFEVQKMTTVLPVMEYRLQQLEKES